MRKDNYCGFWQFSIILTSFWKKNLYWCLKGPYAHTHIILLELKVCQAISGGDLWKSETGAAASETRPTSSQQAQFLTCARSLSPRPTLFACLLVQGVASPAFGVATQIKTRKKLWFLLLYRAMWIKERLELNLYSNLSYPTLF